MSHIRLSSRVSRFLWAEGVRAKILLHQASHLIKFQINKINFLAQGWFQVNCSRAQLVASIVSLVCKTLTSGVHLCQVHLKGCAHRQWRFQTGAVPSILSHLL